MLYFIVIIFSIIVIVNVVLISISPNIIVQYNSQIKTKKLSNSIYFKEMPIITKLLTSLYRCFNRILMSACPQYGLLLIRIWFIAEVTTIPICQGGPKSFCYSRFFLHNKLGEVRGFYTTNYSVLQLYRSISLIIHFRK